MSAYRAQASSSRARPKMRWTPPAAHGPIMRPFAPRRPPPFSSPTRRRPSSSIRQVFFVIDRPLPQPAGLLRRLGISDLGHYPDSKQLIDAAAEGDAITDGKLADLDAVVGGEGFVELEHKVAVVADVLADGRVSRHRHRAVPESVVLGDNTADLDEVDAEAVVVEVVVLVGVDEVDNALLRLRDVGAPLPFERIKEMTSEMVEALLSLRRKLCLLDDEGLCKQGKQKTLPIMTCILEKYNSKIKSGLNRIRAKPTCIGLGKNKSTSKAIWVVSANKEQLQERFDCLIGLGIEHSMLCRMIATAPKLLNQSRDMLLEKTKYLCHDLGYRIEYLNTFPALLFFNLENRIKPRYKILNWLRDFGLMKKPFAPATVVATSEKRFIFTLSIIHPEAPKLWLEFFSSQKGDNGDADMSVWVFCAEVRFEEIEREREEEGASARARCVSFGEIRRLPRVAGRIGKVEAGDSKTSERESYFAGVEAGGGEGFPKSCKTTPDLRKTLHKELSQTQKKQLWRLEKRFSSRQSCAK
ncbi:hypothetical protein KSP40_PGU002098 [Platanthera guangdongensis]|uniref:Uncharacterized protein n=1 Tax=Platanthera guangdongensis TaxID=2320717 RepID=A0ABR2MP18_9ASPA